jgi:hypothetical protein
MLQPSWRTAIGNPRFSLLACRTFSSDAVPTRAGLFDLREAAYAAVCGTSSLSSYHVR